MCFASLRSIDSKPAIRILVIDDDHSFRRLVVLMLERRGFQVISAASGESALERAAQADVALVDMIMPGLSGIETIPLLRARQPRLRIIAASGCAREFFRAGLANLGVERFLSKPFSVEQLIEEIDAHCCLPG